MIRAIAFFVFIFSSWAALAGSPTLSGPATSTDGTVTLTPNQPESPYFLTEYWRLAPGGTWTQLGVSYMGYAYTTNVGSDGLYAYRSRWYNPQGPQGSQYSYWSNIVYVDVYVSELPSSTPNLSVPASDSDGTFNVSWGASSGASHYQLQRRLNSGGWSTVQNNSSTSYTNSNLNTGNYSFRVRACNSVGCTSYSSIKTTSVTITAIPARPDSINIYQSSSTSVVIYWSSVPGATYYVLQTTAGTPIYSGSGTGALYSGSAYAFRVQACNANGCSGWRWSN